MAIPEPDRTEACDADGELVASLTQCQSLLLIYIRSLMPGDRAAEEVLQQANAKIWQKRSEFASGTNFRGWAMAIARYEVLNHRKKQARDARIHFSSELEAIIADEVECLGDDLSARHSALKICLDELKPESRELLLSRYAATESMNEFAARIGRSAGGLRVTLTRLRSMLAQCIQRRLEQERLADGPMTPCDLRPGDIVG